MTNWSLLEPNRPLAPGNPSYVDRPTSATAGLLDRFRQGARVVLVSGPAGIGKSTELANAAAVIGVNAWSCMVPLDQTLNMRTITPHELLGAHVQALAACMKESGRSAMPAIADRDLLLIQLRAFAAATGRPVVFLIDGLEKMPEDRAGPVFDELRFLAAQATLVVVMPWYMTYGPLSQSVIHDAEKVAHLRPVTVAGPGGEAGRKFFRLVLAQRLKSRDVVTAAELKIVDSAAELSGGVPRAFLQLIADAAFRAKFVRKADWPNEDDLYEAALDVQDSFRRLLMMGDREALRAVDGRSGLEMQLDRKLRLLNHGILLEYEEDREVKMRMHPLVRTLMGGE